MSDSSSLFSSAVMIVDDISTNIDVLTGVLGDAYELSVALNGRDALRLLEVEKIDLILLDIMMPGMDGFEVCRIVRNDHRYDDIPIIFLTALDTITDKTRGFEIGAVDYITKPFEPEEVKSRVKSHLAIGQARRVLSEQNQILEDLVKIRTAEVVRNQDAAIRLAASAAETRDNETGNHILRTQRFIRVLAEKLEEDGRYLDEMSGISVELLYKSAPLHDIGKIGVPDSILMKPGKLTDEEFEEMKRHAEYGFEMLQRAERDTDLGSESFLRIAKEIAFTHHERWDGTGYPEGLSGLSIPLTGRLMAVADVYDALTTKRVYKPAMPHEEAADIIRQGEGNHFDPILVDLFESLQEEFISIAKEFT